MDVLLDGAQNRMQPLGISWAERVIEFTVGVGIAILHTGPPVYGRNSAMLLQRRSSKRLHNCIAVSSVSAGLGETDLVCVNHVSICWLCSNYHRCDRVYIPPTLLQAHESSVYHCHNFTELGMEPRASHGRLVP